MTSVLFTTRDTGSPKNAARPPSSPLNRQMASPGGQRPKTAGAPTVMSRTASSLAERTASQRFAAEVVDPEAPRSLSSVELLARRRPQTASTSPSGRSVASPLRPGTAGIRTNSPLASPKERPTTSLDRRSLTDDHAGSVGVALDELERARNTSANSSPRPQPHSPQASRSGIITSGEALSRSTALLRESSLLRERLATAERITASGDDLQSRILNGHVTRLNDVRASERSKSNQTAHGAVRNIRQEAAHLRQAILRLGEEQKLLGKCKSLLEVGVQEKRKGMSFNHQSQATRQKMSGRDQRLTDSCNLILADEARQLSQSKRDLERQLAQVKNQQWEVDKLRKQMVARSQALSSGPLALDCHSPKIVSSVSHGHERLATSLHKPPKSVAFSGTLSTSADTGASTAALGRSPLTASKGSHDPTTTMITQAESMLTASKQLRDASKRLLLGTAQQTLEARGNTDKQLRESSHRARIEECEVAAERGHVRHARAATAHALSCHELAAARARGAVMLEHWDVSERPGRPLTSVDPGLAEEEARKQKQSTETFNWYASKSAASLDRLSGVDMKLTIAMRQKAAAHRTELEVLRMRRRGADNRWIKG